MRQQVDLRPWSTCEMATADTKALRCLDVPATLITNARRRRLRMPSSWSWAEAMWASSRRSPRYRRRLTPANRRRTTEARTFGGPRRAQAGPPWCRPRERHTERLRGTPLVSPKARRKTIMY